MIFADTTHCVKNLNAQKKVTGKGHSCNRLVQKGYSHSLSSEQLNILPIITTILTAFSSLGEDKLLRFL